MKKTFLFVLLAASFAAPALAADPPDKPASDELSAKLPSESLYTVSSDELDASESLNRVSGKIDLGFSAPSQSFHSPDQYAAGPFSREKEVGSS